MDNPSGSIKIEKECIILVEGNDEIRFFRKFLQILEINQIQLISSGGKDNQGNFIRTLIISPDFSLVRGLGIVRDADTSPQRAFQSIHDVLMRNQLPCPEKPLDIASGNPATSILILPRADQVGALEDLCLDSVRNDPAMSCVDEYFNCLRNTVASLPNKMSKAKLHTFLSSREIPDLRLGEAAEAGVWNFQDESLNHIKEFFVNLVEFISL